MATSKVQKNINMLTLTPQISAISDEKTVITVPFGTTISNVKMIIPVVWTSTGNRNNMFCTAVADYSTTDCKIALWSLGGSPSGAQPSLEVCVLY